MPRELALVGGGHAHVEVIRRWGLDPVPDCRLTVFDPNPRPVYSGMVPGFVAGQYESHELEIDLKALCASSRAEFVQSSVARIDTVARTLHFEAGTCAYSIASLDIGSTIAGAHLPGVRDYALPSRPITRLIADVGDLLRAAKDSSDPMTFHVVGGGAGGVELAFCLEARLRKLAIPRFEVTIVTSDDAVLEGAASGVRRRVERALRRRGINVIANSPVAALRANAIELRQGRSLASSGAVWVTGPASHPLASDSGLPVDPGGFVRINPSFQVEGESGLFAVGDCASLPGMKKAGVYAVRSGPLLDSNIRSFLKAEPLQTYSPQHDFLSLLNLGDGTAIGSKWGVAREGRSMMWLKDRIDRSFMEKYR